MKKTMSLIGLGLISVFLGENLAQAVTYGNCGTFSEDEICVCENTSGGGSCRVLGWSGSGDLQQRNWGSIGSSPDGTLAYLNDRITSYKAGSGVSAMFCESSGFGGNCMGTATMGSTVDDLNFDSTNNDNCQFFFGHDCLNNKITSIRMDDIDVGCMDPPQGFATIFTATNYSGTCTVIPIGNFYRYDTNNYFVTTGGAFGLPDDSISSIKVGANTKVYLFNDPLPTSDPGYPDWDWSPLPKTICASGCNINSLSVSNLGSYSFDNVTSAISVVAN